MKRRLPGAARSRSSAASNVDQAMRLAGLDALLFQFPVDRRRVDRQFLGGAGDVAAVSLECRLDREVLDLGQGHALEGQFLSLIHISDPTRHA